MKKPKQTDATLAIQRRAWMISKFRVDLRQRALAYLAGVGKGGGVKNGGVGPWLEILVENELNRVVGPPKTPG